MTMTGFDSFDTAVQKADIWLKELMRELNTDSKSQAYLALRAALHTLRDRLPLDEAVDLSAQLPMLIRGLFFEGWDPSQTPIKDRHKQDFLFRIQQNYRADQSVDTEKIAKAVFRLLRRKVSEGEIKQVQGILPAELKELWV